jgi:hypothetical protein
VARPPQFQTKEKHAQDLGPCGCGGPRHRCRGGAGGERHEPGGDVAGRGSTVTGIGRDAAGAIWYRALSVYMTSSTNYAGARTATLNAARDLYGNGSTQYNTVAAAWSAVSVT